MSRKVTLKIESVVTVNVDEDVDMDELELNIYSDNDGCDIVDFEVTKLEVEDSR